MPASVNGSVGLIQTLVGSGVDTCFMNPGTSEMHFVAALDDVPEMRGILTLFEGVATGAADGYARIRRSPASTLVHLGPGLMNGMANLHNARRAFSSVVNLIGDHATYHKEFDAPLESDVESLAKTVSKWVSFADSPSDLAAKGAEAVVEAIGPVSGVASLIVSADHSWLPGGAVVAARPRFEPKPVPREITDDVIRALTAGDEVAVIVGGRCCDPDGLRAVASLQRLPGVRVFRETFPARMAHGAGLPHFDRLAYVGEQAVKQLAGVTAVVLFDTEEPVSFFAYPGESGRFSPEGARVLRAGERHEDVLAALLQVADAVGGPQVEVEQYVSERCTGDVPLDPTTVALVIADELPENAIVSDESATSGASLGDALRGAKQHDWLTLTGGAIGQGMPVATGAAVAAPDRSVYSLQADGGSLYTLQSLWTQAREQLDVTTIIYNNRSYAILRRELARVGADGSGPRAEAMLDLSNPDMSFVSMANGFGVPASQVRTTGELRRALGEAASEDGPRLIEVLL